MGRKGSGRKGFMKSVRAAGSESDDELTSGTQASSEVSGPTVPADPEDLGVRMQADPEAGSLSSPDQLAPVKTTAQRGSAGATDSSLPGDHELDKPEEQSSSGQDADDELETIETLGQLTQRHRRELKLHKERMKKLGKKKKDEVKELDREVEERHAAELAAAEARNGQRQPTPAEATVASLSAGLYSTKLTADQPSDRKEPTRAQKRRELRALEEAERDVRIEEEQADMGESDKAAEERQLMAELEPLGLCIREIPPDGNCLFRAIEDQIEQADPLDNSSHSDLRRAAASHMQQHPDDYLPFVIQDAASSGEAEEHFSKYCREMGSSAAWGSQAELRALAHVLQRSILVHAVGMPPVQMGEEYISHGPPFQVCYLRHAYGLGEHFNSCGPLLEQAADS